MRKNNFDTLRLSLAVLVVFSHSYTLLGGSDAGEPLYRWSHGLCTFGNVSVWAFFVISGFLITQSWQRSPNLRRFLTRRITRIYPGFIFVTILCGLLVHPIASSGAINLFHYVESILHLSSLLEPNAFPHNPIVGIINGSLWTIQYEFTCYLAVAAFGLIGILKRPYAVIGILALATGIHLFIEITRLDLDNNLAFRIFGSPLIWSILLPFFLVGMLVNLYWQGFPLHGRYAAIAVVLLAGSIFVPHALVFTLPLLGAYLLMWLAYLPELNVLNFGRWGDFSYGTYLYAYPIQQVLIRFLPGLHRPFTLFLLAAPLSVFAGFCSWHLVEKRFLPRATIRRIEETQHPAVAVG